jgi:WD40 repeat protein
VKPSNVMLDPAGRVLLLDFGLARSAAHTQSLTASAGQPGSLPYMSPEQARDDAAAVDARSDLFALGVVLHELLALRNPFLAATAEATRRQILEGRAPPLLEANRAVPWDAVTVCQKAIDPDPARRYQTAADLAEDVARVLSFRPILARRPGVWLRARRWAQRRPTLAAVLALGFVFALFGPLVLWLEQRRYSTQVTAALREAEGRRLTATAVNLLGADPGLALALAIEGASRCRDLAADNALHAALLECHEARTLRVERGNIGDAAFSPDGRLVVTGGSDGAVRLFDAASGAFRATFSGHEGAVRRVCFDRESRRALSASDDGTARIWDVAGGACVVLAGHAAPVQAAVFRGDGRMVATASRDGTVRLWDAASGACAAVLAGHQDQIYTVAFDPSGRQVVSCSEDRTARIWDVATGAELASLAVPGAREAYWGAVFSVEYDPKSERVLAGYGDGAVRLWDARKGTLLRELQGHWREIALARFDPRGERILSVAFDGRARLWDADSGICRHELRGHSGYVVGAAWSGDSRLCATASRDGTVCLWEAGSGKLRARLLGHEGTVEAVMFDPAGERLLSAGGDDTARIWRMPGRRRFKAHGAGVDELVLDPRGRLAATTCADGIARTWDARTWEPVATMRGHDGPVLGAGFDADGQRLLTWSTDRSARVWDARSGRELLRLSGHEVLVGWGAFAAGGRIATVCVGVLRVWDAGDGSLLARRSVEKNVLLHPRLTRDGKRFLAGTYPLARLCTFDLETLQGPFPAVAR